MSGSSKFQFRDETKENSTNTAVDVHYLPFKIEYDGPAENIMNRFTEQIFYDKDSNVAQNYFRGRSLQGDKINLAELNDYEAVTVVQEKMPANSLGTCHHDGGGEAAEEKTFTISSKFDKFTYWNWDMQPTAMDAPVKLTDWLELANILHSPIDPAEVADKPADD